MPWEDFYQTENTNALYNDAGSLIPQSQFSTPSPWEYAQNQNTGFIYSPQQLGWDDATAQRFSQAGITQLPGWFNRDTVYSGAFRLGGRDPVQNYIDLYTTPYDQATSQWDASKKAYQRLFTDSGADTASDAAREAYLREAFGTMNNAKDSWWDRNHGMVMSLGTMASLIGGGYLSGAMGAVEGAGAGLGTGLEATGYGAAEAGAGAGAASGNALTGSLSGINAGEYGLSNAAPVAAETAGGSGIADAIAAGGAAGADVGMGSGTSWLTQLGLPASYGGGLGGAAEYGLSALGAGAGGGGGMGIWDTVSGLFGGGGQNSNSLTSGAGLAQIISSLIGAGGSYMGGQATKDAADKSADILWQMYNQSRQDTSGQRALFDQIAPQLKQQATNPNYPAIPTLQNKVNTDYQNDPIYQQQKEEILRTLNRRMASSGQFNSSSADDAIMRNLSSLMQDSYSRNLDELNRTNQNALQTYGLGYDQNNNLYGRSLDLAKIGAGAAGAAGQNALSTGNALSNNQLYSGQNQANMWGGMAGSAMGGINNYLLYSLLNNRRTS